MAMEDPGWGEYVPSPEEADGGQSPPTGGGGSGSQPPGDGRPWWRRNIVLVVVAGVVVLGIAGGAAGALSSGTRRVEPSPTPVVPTPVSPPVTDTPSSTTPVSPPVTDTPGSTTPVSPPGSTGGSAGDAYAAFVAKADAICKGSSQKLADDYNNANGSLSPDTQDLVNALKQLGSPPSNPDSWQLALEDWQQAADLADVGSQDWLVNIRPGADEFNNSGIHACGAIGDIGR